MFTSEDVVQIERKLPQSPTLNLGGGELVKTFFLFLAAKEKGFSVAWDGRRETLRKAFTTMVTLVK